jgi:hypothetical protein
MWMMSHYLVLYHTMQAFGHCSDVFRESLAVVHSVFATPTPLSGYRSTLDPPFSCFFWPTSS